MMTDASAARRPTQPLRDYLVLAALAIALKMVLDPLIWRYSGPVSLLIMLGIIVSYAKRHGAGVEALGVVTLRPRRRRWLLLPQSAIAFVAIGATGAGVGLAGEALGLAFMAPDAAGPLERFGDLRGNTRLYLLWLVILWIAGPAEELYFRGFMINQLRWAFGSGVAATATSVAIPALLFGLGHVYYQGLRGLVITGAIGLVLGSLFVAFRRNVWPLMIAHAAFNSLAFTAMYAGWDI